MGSARLGEIEVCEGKVKIGVMTGDAGSLVIGFVDVVVAGSKENFPG